jgi:MoxR-like ATPase
MTPIQTVSSELRTEALTDTAARLHAIQAALAERVLGKTREIRLALACILADGHLLIEDLPGVGKTTLAQAIAQVLGLRFARIQFTSDLLPSDILGVSVYDRSAGRFRFIAGPIFAGLVLADEINRASPRTQSALLEAMAERQVTIEGATRTLAPPFMVIATQNPADQSGTFALPDSQLDRFLMCITLGYPPADAERELLVSGSRRALPLTALADRETLIQWQAAVAQVTVRDALLDYLLALVHFTRDEAAFAQGLSPRAGLALRRAAQAWALLDGRDFVLPEDVQAVLAAVVDHRLLCTVNGSALPSKILLEQVKLV